MKERYDIYFSGQVMDGHDLESVRSKLSILFKADQTTLDKLFSGKAQLIKRNCDHSTALKYKNAMEQAGALPVLKALPAETESRTESSTDQSAAEKIAALAATTDDNRYQQSTPDAPSSESSKPAPTESGSIGLAPPGTDVLREEERAEPVTREIDTTALQVDTSGSRLSDEKPPPAATLDTGHLSLADTGDSIPNLPSTDTPVTPNLDGLVLSEPDTDFSDCASPEPPAPVLDLSALAVEPAGTELLEEQYRKAEAGTTPTTDHLSLED
jgi:hypothetical protein